MKILQSSPGYLEKSELRTPNDIGPFSNWSLVVFSRMGTERVSIDLSNTEIEEMEIRRSGEESQEVEFAVEGTVSDVDKQEIDDVMLSNEVKPVSVSLEVERTEPDV